MRRFASHFFHQVLAGTMLFLCLTLLLAACGTSAKEVQTRPSLSLSSELDAFLRAEVKAEQFSGAVLVARKGTILLSKGYGLANDDSVLANTPTTMFGLGPVTEEFTAMAILILQERGKLHIPDPICTYLSSCPPAWQPIAISHLLTHSSGIPSNSDPGGITLMQLEREPLDFKPGTQFNFSNSGYVVLATLIEKVSGEAYGTFLQQNIFAPLQMTHTGYDFTQPHLPNLATGYSSWQRKADYTGISLSLHIGADGLYSTVGDLYRWDQALFTHTQTLVSKLSLNEMFTKTVTICPTMQVPTCSSLSTPYKPQTYASSLSIGYGYGWFIATVEGSKNPIIYHAGKTYGFEAYNTFYSQDNITIIVLSNLDGAPLETIVQTLYQFVTARA
jgi:CubicO group peptidase (beta-lactamase class C family)